MTSSRGQNVSIFQHPNTDTWRPPITAFTDTGGSLRSAPRANGKNGKSFGQHYFKNTLPGSCTKYQNESVTAYAPMSDYKNVSVDRELSPVRWCDRKVDGVYLGKSGWVQVQQNSDGKKFYVEPKNFSTLPTRKSDYRRPECSRPLNLPLPMKKRTVKENYEKPSKFAEEFESVSPPSITPIISPPPAFKDDGLNEFQRRRKLFSKDFLLRSEAFEDTEGSPSPPKDRRNVTNSFSTGLAPSSVKYERLPYRTLQTKSLDEFSGRTWENRRYNSPFIFRSLDIDPNVRELKVSESGSYVNFETPKDWRSYDESDVKEKENEYIDSNGHFCGLPSSEGLNRRNKGFRQRSYQRSGRRTVANVYRTRSSSLDSSNSSSSSSLSGKNSEKSASRRIKPLEIESSSTWDSKHFHVKRSRSLQLSEKRSPSELVLMNNTSSGKSWDPMPPKNSKVQINGEEPFPQHLHHVLVTANGDSIPVDTSGYQSLKSLNKITTSEEEQRKLIMEAKKEARIISEFLSGTRSQAAARNLLMHRYLNRPEDGSPEDVHPKPEYGGHFLEPDRRSNKPSPCTDGKRSFSKKNQLNSNPESRPHPTAVYSKPFISFFRTSGTSSLSSPNCADQKKKENKENGGSSSSGQTSDCRSKRKSQNINRSGDHPRVAKPPLLLWNLSQKTKNAQKHKENFESDPEGPNKFKNSPQILIKEVRNLAESSSLSSSSSSVGYGTNCKKNQKITGDAVVEVNSTKPSELFRPGSAPESDDCFSAEADQRSLSLPRSFLSERYRINYAIQRELFQWKQQGAKTPPKVTVEWPVTSQRSRTAPTTPIHGLRFGKSSESLSQIQCSRSSWSSLLDESPFLSPRRICQNTTSENLELSEVSLNKIYKSPAKISGTTETALQKYKKSFPLKYLKGSSESAIEEIKSEGVENSKEALLGGCRLVSGLQAFQNGGETPEQSYKFARERNMRKKSIKNEKYDSHDSGIQMGHRGNLDSSESQDTDLQEDLDSPLVIRRREITAHFCPPQSEIFNQVFNDKFKADIQWRNRIKKHNYGKGVRRANSDLGGQRLYNWEVKNNCRRLVSYPFSVRGRHGKNIWGPTSPEDAAILNKFIRPQLRRSLSQPLGLNESASFSKRPSMLKGFALSEDDKNPRGKTSEDECLSDSESSVASLHERKMSMDYAPRSEAAILAEAVWDHVAIESSELPFRAGDVIEVLDTRNGEWWWGATSENRGYFPSAFVRLRVNQEDTVEDCLAAMAKGKHASSQLRRGKSVSFLSNDQVRSSVVKELLNTERDFVKILRDIKDGFIIQCKRRTDMFTSSQISTIFSNLEDILVFQEKFLKDLETRVDREFPYKSCIGEIFLTHAPGFRMYSEYCNSHPMAIATLQSLYQKDNYCKFFETCRLKQSLIEIPLDGYLLTPVQRICKYPLQLAELLKYTKSDHTDYELVQKALEMMKRVATLINERKRKMESLEKLAAWQQRVEGWEGEDLIEKSSQLIYQGDVVRITSGMWTSNLTLFLFDHQIVYCKKDLLKKNVYIYKGRIFLDTSVVIDLPDGKNQQLGVTVKYGLKICNNLNDKWLLFCCRSSEYKAKWLEAFADEKRIVVQDKEVGLDLPPTARQLAKIAASKKKCPPCKPRNKNKVGSTHEDLLFRNNHPSATKSKPRRVGNWFTLGGVIKGSKTNFRPRAPLHRVT